jgi:sugar lactone lactonase YvrE
MKNLLVFAGIGLVGVFLFYLLFWPIPGEPSAWQAPQAPSSEHGPYARNERLKAIQRVFTDVVGPEAYAVEPATGALLTGTADGKVVRLFRDGRQPEVFAETGGRPLGLAVCPDGSILVADGVKGLVRIRSKGAPVEILATEADGVPFKFVDNVAVDSAGRYAYFTDASSRWGFGHDEEDVVAHGGYGRVLRYDLASGEITLLGDRLNFANGVLLGPSEDYLLVNESGSYRTLRIWLDEARFKETEVFADNLPGFPDNLSFNGKDRIWVALPIPRNPVIDYLAGFPFVRKMMIRLMAFGHPPLPDHARAVALNLDGKPVAHLHYEGKDAYKYITQVTEIDGDLYFGSLYQSSGGFLPNWQETQ